MLAVCFPVPVPATAWCVGVLIVVYAFKAWEVLISATCTSLVMRWGRYEGKDISTELRVVCCFFHNSECMWRTRSNTTSDNEFRIFEYVPRCVVFESLTLSVSVLVRR